MLILSCHVASMSDVTAGLFISHLVASHFCSLSISLSHLKTFICTVGTFHIVPLSKKCQRYFTQQNTSSFFSFKQECRDLFTSSGFHSYKSFHSTPLFLFHFIFRKMSINKSNWKLALLDIVHRLILA